MQLIWIGFFYAAYFAFVGLYSPFLGPYLKSLGHSLDVIALALGLMQIMRVFGPLSWGWLADYTGKRVQLTRLAIGGGLLMAVITFFNDSSPVHLIVCLVLLNLSVSGLIPLSDVQAMDVCKGDAGLYGRVRLFGSLGFVAAVLGFGVWAEYFGLSAFQWWVYVCLGLACLSTWYFREVPLTPSGVLGAVSRPPSQPLAASSNPSSLGATWGLLRPLDLQLFWGASFFMVLAHGVFYSFYSLYLLEYDYSKSTIGGLWALGVMCEVAFFAVQTQVFGRLGRVTWLQISYGVCALRFAAVAAYPELFWVMALAQAAHALTFAAHHTASISWLRERLPASIHGRAQAMYATVAYGLGGTSGTFLGRWMWDTWSPSHAFWAASVAACAAFVLGYYLSTQPNAPR